MRNRTARWDTVRMGWLQGCDSFEIALHEIWFLCRRKFAIISPCSDFAPFWEKGHGVF